MLNRIGFILYMVFVTSWFLHLTSRIPLLGSLRVDLVLIGVLAILAFLSEKDDRKESTNTDTNTLLKVLIIFIIIAIPFVEWPGSVIRFGLPGFIKAIVFYYFTILFIHSEKQLKIFIGVVLVCQSIRVFEPLYLHITEGYWGSSAYAQGEYMNRLAGGPSDIVNPNGLAFIIASIIPFYYFLAPLSKKNMILFLFAGPLSIYALILTGSRSGMIGFFVILLGFILKSKHRLAAIIIIGITAVVVFLSLSPAQQDRYISIIDSNSAHAGTVQGRVDGLKDNIAVALRKPIFGHGLGTSAEANYHYAGIAQLSHNLYAEITQELGFVGLVIFLLFMKSIILNFSRSYKALKTTGMQRGFLMKIIDTMQVWLAMNILFSFASYGLSSYAWYMFGGLSVIVEKLALQARSEKETAE